MIETEVPGTVKEELGQGNKSTKKPKKRSCSLGLSYFVSNKDDVEKVADGTSDRPTRLIAPLYCGFAAALSLCE